jgi:hypothetical protein
MCEEASFASRLAPDGFWLRSQVAVFFFFPGPEFKKPESPGRAKKDY